MGTLLKSPVTGKTEDVAPEQVDSYLGQRYEPVSAEARAGEVTQAAADARENERGVVGTLNAGFTSGLSGLTAGGSDLLLRGFLDKGEFERLRGERGAHPVASVIGDVAGTTVGALASGGESLLAKTPAAGIAKLGARLAHTGEEAGALAKIARATYGGVVEGGLYGAGQATSELALSDDPLTLERAASVYSSNMLFGGAVGGAAGTLTKVAELGLGKAKGAIDSVVERNAAQSAVPEELASLDRAGLRVAEKTEREAIEAAAVPQRQQLADDLGAFRQEAKDQKLWLATKKADDVVEVTGPVVSETGSGPRELLGDVLSASDQLPVVDSGRVRLYRASDRDGIARGSHLTPDLESAVKYSDNPGFGGSEIRSYDIKDEYVLDVFSVANKRGDRAALDTLATELELPDPAGVAEAWWGKGYRKVFQVLEHDPAAIKAAEKHYEWIRFSDDFPPRAETWRKLGSDIEHGALLGKRGVEAGTAKPSVATAGAKAMKLSTEDARAVREIGKISLEADKAIDRTLRNPKALAENPKRALAALQQQEHALERLVGKSEALRPTFAADKSGARVAALDAIPGALEKNRAFQKRIAELAAAPASERLTQIANATDVLSSGGKKTIAEQMLAGAGYSLGAGAAFSVGDATGIPGAAFLAPFAGATAAKLVTGKVFGRMGKAMAGLAERSQKAVGAFLDVTKKVAPAAPVLATKVLSSIRYAPPDSKADKPVKGEKKPATTLAAAYKARADELRNQVAPGPDGKLAMRPDARAKIADRLSPVASHSPVFADKLETNAVKRIEWLANELPRRPELAGIPTGPDRWQPSDMDMRTWARKAAAVEDPHAVFERLAHGSITPEDADALRAVYPELMNDFTQQIVTRLPELRESLPYQRRIALSIFTGVPVDAAMDPSILSALQASFSSEPGTEGGTQAPEAAPQFGSLSKTEPTPAQTRAG